METLTYYFDKKVFKINIERTNNKNMYLKIRSGIVICLAPYKISFTEVKKFVDIHARNFYEYLEKVKINKLYSLNKNFIYIFGEKYFITRLTGVKRTKITFSENKMYIYAIDNSDEKIEEILKKILKDKITKYVAVRQKYFEKIMEIPTHSNKFVYKTTTWGTNYVQKRRIIYSTKLAHYRKEVIDYVIVHELAHNKYPNHSNNFWKEVGKFQPNFRENKKELKANSSMINE